MNKNVSEQLSDRIYCWYKITQGNENQNFKELQKDFMTGQ